MSDSLTNHSFELNLFSELVDLVLFVNKTSKHEVNFPFKTFSIILRLLQDCCDYCFVSVACGTDPLVV